MIGVIRVHKHQADFLLNDTNACLSNFKKSLFHLQTDKVDMVVAQARPETITLQEKGCFKTNFDESCLYDENFKVPFPIPRVDLECSMLSSQSSNRSHGICF